MKKSIKLLGAVMMLADVLSVEARQQLPEPEIISTVIPEEIVSNMDYISHYTPREFDVEEAQMLMRIAQAEAGNQGVKGMMLVMMVVLNRVQDEAFPDSIEGVIFQENQFQPVSDGAYYSVSISPEAHLALAKIESGMPLDDKIIGFEITSNNRTLERYFDYSYTVGGHDFYVSKRQQDEDIYLMPLAAGGSEYDGCLR